MPKNVCIICSRGEFRGGGGGGGGSGVQTNLLWLKISFLWDILDKFELPY